MKINKKKIFIAENIPSLNKGEMTILGGMLESFKLIGNFKVTMISDLPKIDGPRCSPDVDIVDVKRYLPLSSATYHRSRIVQLGGSLPILIQHIGFLVLYKIFGIKTLKIMNAPIWRSIAESDVIVLGHNGSFSLGGSLGAPIFLYPVLIPFMAKQMHKPIIFYGGSIFKIAGLSLPLRYVLKSTLSRFDIITLREEDSYRHIKELNLKTPKVFLTADPACLLRPAGDERMTEIMIKEGLTKTSQPLIGLTLTRAIASGSFKGLTSQESYTRHNQMCAAIIDRLIATLGANIIFIPHCIGNRQNLDDRIVCKDVLEQCQNKTNIKLINTEYTASELKGLIGHCDLFIGERTHSVINALTMHVPSVVLAHSSDQRLGIIKMIGQEKAIFNIDSCDKNALFAGIMSIWEKRKEIRNELVSQVALIQEKAIVNGQLLQELLASLQSAGK